MRTRRSPPRLFIAYVAVSLLPVLALGVAIEWTVRNDIDQHALIDARDRASALADAVVEPALTGHDLSAGVTDSERANLRQLSGRLAGDATVLRLRLRAPEGTIVFDAAHPDAPPEPDHDAEVIEAAEGHPLAQLTKLNADAVDATRQPGVGAVEIYLALHGTTGQTIGVLEMYLPYAPFAIAAGSSKHHVTMTLFTGLLALWLVLGLVTRSATRRLRRVATDNEWLAHHDQLTGLLNRVGFLEAIEQRWTSGGAKVAVLDISGFRQLNDTLGHANGDAFLGQLAARLLTALPLGGTAARLGGNEFGVLWSDDESSVIQRITAAVNEPVELAGITVGREVAIGMATRSPQLDQPASLLRAAEIALHAAKDTNRSIVVHSPVLDTFDADRLALASELRRALDGDELALHYQPKVDLDGGHVHSFEALVRWNHPQRGMIMPDEFVPLAESTSLITALTTWVIEAAAEQLARWDGLDVSVSINVSAHDFAAGDLADRLLRSLQTHRVDPGRLGIEITETAVVADPAQAGILLRTLRKLGVAVSLDDFGQGATSLASLATLPFTELKVDRSFVTGLADNPIELAIVSSLIDLGHRLGLTVTAEGIEDERSAELLRAMGCDHGQGYRFARAMAAEAVPGWLAQQHVLADLAGAPGQV